MTDEQLVRKAGEGDREALAELFARYQQPLFAFFTRSFAAPEDAEDLVMDTLLRVFRNAGQFRGGSFRGWIYQLALNVGRDRLRRVRRRPELLASAVAEEWETVRETRIGGSPEASALRDEWAGGVRAALQALPEKERAALILREYQQLSYLEISVALGASLPCVKMLLLRGRKRLRASLEASPLVREGSREPLPEMTP